MQAFITLLKNEKLALILENESLASYTTIKIGGPTPYLIIPNSLENAGRVIKIAQEREIEFYTIGRGSNVVISDKGIKKPVIKLNHNPREIQINNNELYVEAGYPLIQLVNYAKKHNLSGLEFAAGIPASVGGAIYMNAGAHGSNISKILKRALILFKTGELKWLQNSELKFNYRSSLLQKEQPGIVLAAVFELHRDSATEIKRKIQEYKEYRIKTQPYDKPNAGSIFRNPLPLYAGKIIEDLHLRGFSIGGAMVSTTHCNFIVNENNATYDDVCNLIKYIQEKTHEKMGVELKTEIEFISD